MRFVPSPTFRCRYPLRNTLQTDCLSLVGVVHRNDDPAPHIIFAESLRIENVGGEEESYRTITSHCPALLRLNNGPCNTSGWLFDLVVVAGGSRLGYV